MNMRNTFRTNLLTGLFIVIAVLCVAGLLVYLQDMRPGVTGIKYFVEFPSAPGIRKNSQVLVGGKKVGVVSDVWPNQKLVPVADKPGETMLVTSVLITWRLENQYAESVKIYNNASASVTSAFFGASSININPGGPGAGVKGDNRVAEVLAPDNQSNPIIGISPTTFDDLQRKGEKVLDESHANLRMMKEVLGDPELKAKIKEGISAVADAGKQLEQIINGLKPGLERITPTLEAAQKTTESVAAMIEENRAALREILDNTKGITAASRDFMEKRLDGLAVNLEKLAVSLNELATNTNAVIDENRQNLNATLTNLRETSVYVKDLSAKLRRDPSILLWGTSEADNAADRQPVTDTSRDDFKLRDSGRLPPRERD